MKASSVGHVECVKLLLNRGAQINMQNKVIAADIGSIPVTCRGGCSVV